MRIVQVVPNCPICLWHLVEPATASSAWACAGGCSTDDQGVQESGAAIKSSSESNDIMSAINRHGTVVLEGNTKGPSLPASHADAAGSNLLSHELLRPRQAETALDDLRVETDAAFEALELQDPARIFGGHAAAAPSRIAEVDQVDLIAVLSKLDTLKYELMGQSSLEQTLVASVIKEITQDGVSNFQGHVDASAGKVFSTQSGMYMAIMRLQ